jgi:hypothetical protein
MQRPMPPSERTCTPLHRTDADVPQPSNGVALLHYPGEVDREEVLGQDDGHGPLFHRRYRARIRDCDADADAPNPIIRVGFLLVRGRERTALLESTKHRMRTFTELALDGARSVDEVEAAAGRLVARPFAGDADASEKLADNLRERWGSS